MSLPEARSVNRVCFYKMGVPDLCSLTRAVLVTENHCKHDEQLLSGHSYIYIYTEGSASDIFNSSFHAVNTLFREKPRWNGDGTWPPWSAQGFCFSSIVVKVVLASQRPNWSDNLIFKGYKRLHTAPAERKTLLSLYPFRLLPRVTGAQKGVEKKKKKKGQFFGCAFFHNTGFQDTSLPLPELGRPGIFMPLWILKGHDIVKNIIFKTVMTKGHRMHMLECHFLHSKRQLALFGYDCSARRSPELSARWAVCIAFYSF